MPGKPQVTLTFAGDSSKLEKAFENVGSSARGMGTDVGNASKKIGDSKDGFDKAADGADGTYDKFDALESVGRGTTDTMSGLGEIMKGNVLQGSTDLAGGIAALADGFTGAVLPMIKMVATTGAQTVATVANTVASKAAAAASKVWAAGQWLLNAALTANPIGLVVLAIVALVAIFVLAWKHSDTFRKVVTGAFQGIVAVASAVGKWFAEKLWPWLKNTFDKVSGAVTGVKDWITTKFTDTVTWLKGLPGKISTAVSGLFGKVTSLATAAKDWVTDKLGDKGLVGWIKGLPKKIGSAASGMFDGIKSAFKSALNWLIGKWNGLEFGFPAIDTHIPGVGKVGGFTLGTPNLPYFHTGGIVPGSLGSETLAVLKAGERVTGGVNSPTPLPAVGDFYITVEMDGQQFDARIKSVVRDRDRELKRTVKAG